MVSFPRKSKANDYNLLKLSIFKKIEAHPTDGQSFLSSFKPSPPSPSNCRISRQNFVRKIVKVDRFDLLWFSCPYYFKILSYFCLNIITLVGKTENLVLGLSLGIGLMHVIVPRA